MITFQFNGKNYVVSDEAIKKKHIVLFHDFKILTVQVWEEVDPPIPKEIVEEDQEEFKKRFGFPAYLSVNSAYAICARQLVPGEYQLLQKGDTVFYAAGANDSHVEALAVVVDKPLVSIQIRITKMVVNSESCPWIVEGKEMNAGPREIFRLQ